MGPSRALLCSSVCLAALLSLVPLSARGADYRLQAGDVVEISVAGAPDLRQRVPVQLDGTLALPVAGRIPAAGTTLAEVQARIQMALASTALRSYTADGREMLRIFERDQISASVVEYRPVFVSGNVVRPGEQAFRPRMTVRQAWASAGGSATGRLEAGAAGEAAQLRADYVANWISLAAWHARVWRLKAELGEETAFDRAALPPAPVSEPILEQLLAREAEYRKTRQSDRAREEAYLRDAIAEADRQIAALTSRQGQEEEGVEADTAEFQRATRLLRQGLLTNSRVVDTRRVLLFSSTRELQTAVQLITVRRQRIELQHDLERVDDQRRIHLLEELQEASLKLSSDRVRLEAVEEKLRLAGMPLPRGSEAGDMTITLVRTGENGSIMIPANMDTELQPGDVVDIGRGPGPAELLGEGQLAESRRRRSMLAAAGPDTPGASRESAGAPHRPAPPSLAVTVAMASEASPGTAPPPARMATNARPPMVAAGATAGATAPVPRADEGPPSLAPRETGMARRPKAAPMASADTTASAGAAPAQPSARGKPADPAPKAAALPLASAVGHVRPEPAADQPSRSEPEQAMIAALLRRGHALLALGDISGARRFFERAALSGSAEGALAAGGTHDPIALGRLRAVGIQPDPAAAAAWYRRATELGAADAEIRLAALNRAMP
ncbi:polysaccharide biosynthesis/export family protein [Siccirubricoccus sp. G192]|uniref:polysaccharide biosynthesis/export family protein n=1 Tax=Siccirubricoccus sp. G192 TaxID=2849651 RepID=UPI001C2B9CEC|nr:polysaccharide biosynthesis/export family protein [Siccirubricoccus sp. G192]MBV1797539.1 polysaccharide biosynthesis/export family protein [Siccirubricoccus sp. G192]